MKYLYNFSIIIPHYNNEQDLRRCMASIPDRDDVQIIIVDDNSDPKKVDFDHFPGLDRKNTDIIFSKGENGKGPGYARNLGMDKALGKWIIFSDSDDYFCSSFEEILSKYVDSDVEVYFFCCKKQSESGVVSDYLMINDAIDLSCKSGNSDAIAYGVPCPWGKLIKRNFLVQNNIRYQQVTGGDDVLFSVQIATHLQKYELSDSTLYCVVDRPGSLTRNNNWQNFYSYVGACCEAYKYMKPYSKESLAYSWIVAWWGFLWAEKRMRALSLFPRVIHTMGLLSAMRCFKKSMRVGAWNWKNREK
ncbi:MAG TPA: glycosyltransferase family A protein [Paludibacteraceae bacterium]|nr:glycosyltransferase family A protein [Paludibacteraceae bacterium]HQJ89050.1 glycosyltransferase family A protein [Paludibacteraceae bacterium]